MPAPMRHTHTHKYTHFFWCSLKRNFLLEQAYFKKTKYCRYKKLILAIQQIFNSCIRPSRNTLDCFHLTFNYQTSRWFIPSLHSFPPHVLELSNVRALPCVLTDWPWPEPRPCIHTSPAHVKRMCMLPSSITGMYFCSFVFLFLFLCGFSAVWFTRTDFTVLTSM